MNRNGKEDYQCIAMACQGGGALGAYHIGALKAMQEAGYAPDVVAGISIGAFTAAIIAGNEPANRIAKLDLFWKTISWPDIPPVGDDLGFFKKWHNAMSCMQAFAFGQPRFFKPWFLPPQLHPVGTAAATSYYDNSLMHQTLLDVVDFELINKNPKTQLILGATRVRDGSARWFDNTKEKIGPEHVMASGAMPPGFPGVRIDGDLYWDGGCFSNTPVSGIYDQVRKKDTLCFVIDLFGPSGTEPQNMSEVTLAMKEIQFSNRIANHIERINQRHILARLLGHVMKHHPHILDDQLQREELEQMASDAKFDIIHIQYLKRPGEVATCDCEFSTTSIAERQSQGYSDMKKSLEVNNQLMRDQKASRSQTTLGSVVNTFARGNCIRSSFYAGSQDLERVVTEPVVRKVNGTRRGLGSRPKTHSVG